MNKFFCSLDKRSQNGSIVVEGILSFCGFLLFIFTILNIVNYCRVQSLISNAVDSAAKEMSQYAYFYKMSGLQKLEGKIAENGQMGADNLNNVIGTVDNLYKSLGTLVDNSAANVTNVTNAVESGTLQLNDVNAAINGISHDASLASTSMNTVLNAFNRVDNDPLLYMRSMVAVAASGTLDGIKSYVIAAPLARLFFAKHFGDTLEEANEVLENLGVVGGLYNMNFNTSTIFSPTSQESQNEIHIVVYYKLKLTQFFNMTDKELAFCKEARTIAWLGGDNPSEFTITASQPTSSSAGNNASNNQGNNEEEKDENDENKGEEDEDSDTEDNLELTQSTGYWNYTELDERNWNPREQAFREELVNSYNLEPETLVINGVLYGRDVFGTAYGMDYCATVEDLHIGVAYTAFDQIRNMEDIWEQSGGENGYEPGSTTAYKYIVYVPENISDDRLDEMHKEANENLSEVLAYKSKTTGINIDFSVEFVKAGGTYNYG